MVGKDTGGGSEMLIFFGLTYNYLHKCGLSLSIKLKMHFMYYLDAYIFLLCNKRILKAKTTSLCET